MRQWWLVLRYRDDLLQPNPAGDGRNSFLLYPPEGRRYDHLPVYLSQASAEAAAVALTGKFPTDSIVVLGQTAVYEIPEVPKPVRKTYNAKNELTPDA